LKKKKIRMGGGQLRRRWEKEWEVNFEKGGGEEKNNSFTSFRQGEKRGGDRENLVPFKKGEDGQVGPEGKEEKKKTPEKEIRPTAIIAKKRGNKEQMSPPPSKKKKRFTKQPASFFQFWEGKGERGPHPVRKASKKGEDSFA